MFILHGQMPSGKNQVKITRTGHRYPSSRFVAWRDDAMQQLAPQVAAHAQQGASLPIGSTIRLSCYYVPGDKRVRDVPGILDALCHLIVKAGLLVDDGLVRGVIWDEGEMDRKAPSLEFRIVPLLS